jgi:hypothetical protein
MHRWLCWLLVGLLSGCAAGPSTQSLCPSETAAPNAQTSEAADPAPHAAEVASPTALVRIERGRPNRFLDGTGRIFGVPQQLLYWNRRVNNHQVSAKTEQLVAEYLLANDLPEVLVRVNQYAPLAEWKRLKANRRIGAGWRYTVGVFDLLLYTLIPGRLFGDDWYNPFTDTINLYSDVPSIALHEAAYAKDVHHRRYPGTYVTIQHVPVIGMWYRTNATADTLQYLKQHGYNKAELQEADEILYPMYGGAAGGQIGKFIPLPFIDIALNLAGTGVGHVVGRYRAHQDRAEESTVETQQKGGEINKTSPPAQSQPQPQ